MKLNLIKYFKSLLYLLVFTGYSLANSGSYEDFFKAVRMDDARTVQQLLARGFDVNTVDATGQTGLLMAVREPSPKVARLLLDTPKADLNLLSTKGESPLMLAALKGQLELAEAMVKKGADVNKTGWTPLHYAASTGQLPLIRLLLENHAYIDAESPNGSTPLMMASMYGSPEAVKLLLDEGADPSLKNQQGLTAVQFARKADREDAAQILMKAIRASRPPGQW
ncbi:MAG: Ankyrin [Polaromonas sp.]|nr:Ankyrin [Polaromonas sp.]